MNRNFSHCDREIVPPGGQKGETAEVLAEIADADVDAHAIASGLIAPENVDSYRGVPPSRSAITNVDPTDGRAQRIDDIDWLSFDRDRARTTVTNESAA